MNATLDRLALWQADRCDGTWEHHHGIAIVSTDNPGWWVKIDLEQTPLAARVFVDVAEGIDAGRHPCAERWLSLRVEAGVWHGAGDVTRLEDILRRFLDWAEA